MVRFSIRKVNTAYKMVYKTCTKRYVNCYVSCHSKQIWDSSCQGRDAVECVRFTVMAASLLSGFLEACFASFCFVIIWVSWRNGLGSHLLRYREGTLPCVSLSSLGSTILRSSYVVFAVSTISLICEGISSGSASETVHLQSFFMSSASFPMPEQRKDPRVYVLTCIGSRSARGSSLISSTSGRAVIACCTFIGQVIIIPVLFRRTSCSTFSG